MATLPKEIQDSPTVKAIYAAYEKRAEGQRRYLGASIIGKACARAIWYDFRWAGREQFSGRMLRLFETGQLEESRFGDNLTAIGCEVHLVDPNTKQQFEVRAIAGHFAGHIDGACLGIPEAPKTWHLLEMKTHNAKSFAAIKKKGVQESKPEHWAQMQVYMHLAELDRALYLAKNKDTDELYAERIHYDKAAAEQLMEKAEAIIGFDSAPSRISEDPESFACKFCNHKERCHGIGPVAVPVEVTCRSCCHSTPIVRGGFETGVWQCEKHNRALSDAEQRRACDDHIFIPSFITFARTIDADSVKDVDEHEWSGDWIEYQTPDGNQFKNGKQPGQYRSIELTQLPSGGTANGFVMNIKKIGGEVVSEAA
jgi:hypothetical protein